MMAIHLLKNRLKIWTPNLVIPVLVELLGRCFVIWHIGTKLQISQHRWKGARYDALEMLILAGCIAVTAKILPSGNRSIEG